MKKVNAKRWIEISTNLGIVAGLLLVAAQVKRGQVEFINNALKMRIDTGFTSIVKTNST